MRARGGAVSLLLVAFAGATTFLACEPTLQQETGVKFKIAEDPLRCVVRGTGMALERLDEIADLLIKP